LAYKIRPEENTLSKKSANQLQKLAHIGIKRLMEHALFVQAVRTILQNGRKDMNSKQIMDFVSGLRPDVRLLV
jgi:hypothetical protein